MGDMQGKVVAITGASKGIGAAAVRAFAAAGAQVALLSRDREAIAALAEEVGNGALALSCDVADWAGISAALRRVSEKAERLDVLVNNAGVIDPIARISQADPAEWARAVQVNLTGVFHGLRAGLPLMRAGGTVINVSSGAAHNALEGWSAYCAAKAGAAMLTRAAHVEEGPRGLRIMGLSPGTVATDMQHRIRDSGVNPVSRLDWSAHIPPEWPARALVWMCGPEADPWLGQEISLRDEEIRRRVGLTA